MSKPDCDNSSILREEDAFLRAADTARMKSLCSKVQKSEPGWTTDYYKLPEGATELQDLIEVRGMNFAMGNIFKAAYRLGEKDGISAAYDLNKIVWFAKREIARLERAGPKGQ